MFIELIVRKKECWNEDRSVFICRKSTESNFDEKMEKSIQWIIGKPIYTYWYVTDNNCYWIFQIGNKEKLENGKWKK